MTNDESQRGGEEGLVTGRVAAIKQSLRVFFWGIGSLLLLIALVPVEYAVACSRNDTTGIPPLLPLLPLLPMGPAIFAVIQWARIGLRRKAAWNPASAYLSAGAYFGSLVFLLSLLLSCALAISGD